MKRDYFLLIDTETTVSDKVADFAAVVVDRKGEVYSQCAVLVNGVFTNMELHTLFHNVNISNTVWSKNNLKRRYATYNAMVVEGSRMIAAPAAINVWLEKVCEKYNPFLTAYNLSFDMAGCCNTGIDLTLFRKSFCLWFAACSKHAHTRQYRNFCLDIHAFNAPTKKGNMTYKTDCETMGRFIISDPNLPAEPHTAMEDIIIYELPILLDILKKMRKKDWLNPPVYNWRKVQVRGNFKAK